MDWLYHGRKSFNKKRCLETKSKINRSFSRCDAVTSLLARITATLFNNFRIKHSIFSVCLYSTHLLVCIPLVVSVDQSYVSGTETNNHPTTEVSNKGGSIGYIAEKAVQCHIQSANISFTNET